MAGSTFLRTLLLINLAIFSTAAILPRVPQGQQFITGACVSDSDCASDCCAFTTGKCAGAVIAQQRDGGCGFGDGVPNNRAAQVIQGPNALAAPGVVNGAAPAAPVAAAPAPAAPAAVGTQFITGACANDAACASGCCNARTGLCAARLVAEEFNSRAGGCGRGSGAPVAAAPAPAAAPPAAVGTQFITGACANDAACASGCCNARTGLCAARLVAEEFNSRAGGCGFSGAPVARRTVTRSVVAKRQGSQFITGACANDAACASGCCNARTGLCAARLVAEEFNSRAGGCGFNGAPAAAPAAAAPAAAAPAAVGTQFITGACASDSACASGCCNARTGLCAARLVAEEFNSRAGGCGFGGVGAPVAAPVAAAPAPAAVGTQFITGACTADANCASGCCGFRTGKCAGAIIALERDGGCGFGNAVSNGDAAARLRAGLRR